jgi:hypothetical protein
MKYLKAYMIFESTDEIKRNIMDILLPISDDGIPIIVEDGYIWSNNPTYGFKIKDEISSKETIKIFIGDPHDKEKSFYLSSYIEDLKRLNDYLESKGWVLCSDESVSDRKYGFNKWIDNIEKSKHSYLAVPMFYIRN